MHQKLLTFREEVAKEREVLERELRETMNEVDQLHTKEDEMEKLLKHLEEQTKCQAEELAQPKAKLKRKDADLQKKKKKKLNCTSVLLRRCKKSIRPPCVNLEGTLLSLKLTKLM